MNTISDLVDASSRVLVVTYQYAPGKNRRVCQACEKLLLAAKIPSGPRDANADVDVECDICGANAYAFSGRYYPHDPDKCAAYVLGERMRRAKARGGTVTSVGVHFGWEASLGAWTSDTYAFEARAWDALLARCGI